MMIFFFYYYEFNIKTVVVISPVDMLKEI